MGALVTSAPEALPQDAGPADTPGTRFDLGAWVDGLLARRPAVGFAVAIVRDRRLEQFVGRGVADVAARTPITLDTEFRVGSITKTFTALAVMQLVEEGLVELDAPARASLRAYRLVSRRGRGEPTLRHLLTHTAGIPDVRRIVDLLDVGAGPWDARPPAPSVQYGETLPPLSEEYAGGLEVVADPGSTYSYSGHGFATLGQIVEDVSGMPLDRYLRERIFLPLGMTATDLVRTDAIAGALATGYVLGPAGPEAASDRDWSGPGAGGAYASARDLARYAAALLGGGANEHGSVLRASTLHTMFERQYETDPALPAMGLGFFLTDAAGHRVVSHDGILPGFNSHLTVVPDAGLGLIGLTNGSAGAMRWLPTEMDDLLHRLLGAPRRTMRPAVPHHPEVWGEIVGRYVLPPGSDLRGRLFIGGGLEIVVRGGRPMLRLRLPVPALWRGVPLEPDDERDARAFRADLAGLGMGELRLRFRRDAASGRVVLHTDLGGQPISFESAPARHASRRRVIAGAAVVAALGWLARARRRPHVADQR